MAYLLDGVVILIFLLAVYSGYRRGFIKTVAGIAAFLVALAVSAMFAEPVGTWVYDTMVEPPIHAAVSEQIDAAGQNISVQIDAAYEAMPAVVKNLLTQTGIADAQALEQHLVSQAPQASSSPAHRAMDVIRPVLLPLINAVCSLALFIIIYILARILLRVLDVVAKLPVLKQLNKALGVVGGILSGMLWVLVATLVIQVLAATGKADSVITLSIVNDTWLVSRVIAINPLGGALLELIK